MQILKKPIKKSQLLDAEVVFDGPMVKGVVDLKNQLIGLDANMHADIAQMFIQHGSQQADLWGFSLFPEESGQNFIDFSSMINIRPQQNNRGRTIEDPRLQEKIASIIHRWIQ